MRQSLLRHLIAIGRNECHLLKAPVACIMRTHVTLHAASQIAVIATLVLRNGQTIHGQDAVIKLVALHHQCHSRAVTLHMDNGLGLGRDSLHLDAAHHRHHSHKNRFQNIFLHESMFLCSIYDFF